MNSGQSKLYRFLSVVVVMLLLAGVASAQKPEPPAGQDADAGGPQRPGEPEEPAPEAVTQYLHITGSSFVPMYWDAKPVYDYGGCTYGDATATPSRVIYNLPVILPSESVINQIRFYYKDTSASDSTLRLREMDDGQGLVDIGSVSSSGDTGYGNVTLDNINHEVDYVNYSYVLQWYANVAGSTMELCAVRITYTPPIGRVHLLPTMLRNAAP